MAVRSHKSDVRVLTGISESFEEKLQDALIFVVMCRHGSLTQAKVMGGCVDHFTTNCGNRSTQWDCDSFSGGIYRESSTALRLFQVFAVLLGLQVLSFKVRVLSKLDGFLGFRGMARPTFRGTWSHGTVIVIRIHETTNLPHESRVETSLYLTHNNSFKNVSNRPHVCLIKPFFFVEYRFFLDLFCAQFFEVLATLNILLSVERQGVVFLHKTHLRKVCYQRVCVL
mmetsp:Transcript_36655/g.39771  ORF Transcript_36655/g.39771 Transcript_36655/m.39771 type:complete len:226 (-) Transcript_36655:424-1101(-)